LAAAPTDGSATVVRASDLSRIREAAVVKTAEDLRREKEAAAEEARLRHAKALERKVRVCAASRRVTSRHVTSACNDACRAASVHGLVCTASASWRLSSSRPRSLPVLRHCAAPCLIVCMCLCTVCGTAGSYSSAGGGEEATAAPVAARAGGEGPQRAAAGERCAVRLVGLSVCRSVGASTRCYGYSGSGSVVTCVGSGSGSGSVVTCVGSGSGIGSVVTCVVPACSPLLCVRRSPCSGPPPRRGA
jgi:hypothetical protein